MASENQKEFKFDCFFVKCAECRGDAKVFLTENVVVMQCEDCGSENGEEVSGQ